MSTRVGPSDKELYRFVEGDAESYFREFIESTRYKCETPAFYFEKESIPKRIEIKAKIILPKKRVKRLSQANFMRQLEKVIG